MEPTKVDAATGQPYLVPFPAPEADAAPGSVMATLAIAHGAAPIVIEDFLAAVRKIAADPLLKADDQTAAAIKATRAREVVASLEGRLDKSAPVVETADKKLAESRASLQRRSAKPYDSLRAMSIAAWIRDTKREERGRVIARALELQDWETISAALNSPLVWEAFPDPRWRERAERALLEATDPAALAELDRLAAAIQSVKEAHTAAKVWIRRRAGIETNADLTKQKENTNEN